MSGNLSWYQKHLGVPTPQAPAAPQAVPQFLPGPNGQVYRVVPEAPQQQPQPYGQGPQLEAPIGQIHASDAARLWKGTYAAQTAAGRCPHCNSGNWFAKLQNRPGHCFDCGYRDTSYPSEGPMVSGPVQDDGNGLIRVGGEKIPVVQARSAVYTSPTSRGQGFQIIR